MVKRIVVTGGAGFVGSNYVSRLIKDGHVVTVFDNLSRKGADKNLAWLQASFPNSFEFVNADVRDADALKTIVKDVDAVFHFAAQVAVTSSVSNPREDFEINALGTLNVLEAVRASKKNPLVVYSSTNKVYGGLETLEIKEDSDRYCSVALPQGVPESYPLDFHSPYGCSKGAADQYVRDYNRIYEMPTLVLRQSCIYGPRQFGIEDQGWVAWFIICAVLGRKFSIYGDGKQVRDLLYIDDLMNIFDIALKNPESVAGKIYNVGGGLSNSISVWHELGPILMELFGRKLSPEKGDWRPGDQRFFVADCTLAQKELGWKPEVSVKDGIKNLYEWINENKELFS